MIRRGSRLSQALAILTLLAPVALIGGLFMSWASQAWTDAGARLQAADAAWRAALARQQQTLSYELLADAWTDYAGADISLISQAPSAAAAQEAIEARLDALFDLNGGSVAGAAGQAEGDAAAAPPLWRPVRRFAQPTAFDALLRVGVVAEGVLPESATADFLRALESEPPYIFIDRLEIEEDEAGGAPGRVRIRLWTSTFWLRGPAL